MKRLYVLLLILVLPLQSLWAAGQLYHALGDGHAKGSISIAHSHGHAHDHTHDADLSNSDSSSESDHHHHCTGHGSVVLLPSFLSNLQPDLRYDNYTPEPIRLTSHPNTRIERPNWC